MVIDPNWKLDSTDLHYLSLLEALLDQAPIMLGLLPEYRQEPSTNLNHATREFPKMDFDPIEARQLRENENHLHNVRARDRKQKSQNRKAHRQRVKMQTAHLARTFVRENNRQTAYANF